MPPKKKRRGFKNKKKKRSSGVYVPEVVVRVRLPRGDQVIGICERRLGGSRMKVICLDGKVRVCRIPGRLKRLLWVREGDTLLIQPWEFTGDRKGDVVYKYRRLQVAWLKRNGHLKGLEDLDDF